MSTLAELSIFPLDKGESLSPYVAKVIKVIQASGLAYELTPMGTCLEGEFTQVMQTVQDCFHVLEPECKRIYLSLKIDYRQNRTNGLKQKVESVTNKL